MLTRRVPVAAAQVARLNGIHCVSRAGCWAVGSYLVHRETRNEALHWNGHSWSVVSTPDPDGTAPDDANQLLSVSCTSTASCWAVGNLVQDFSVPLNQALHWNGHRWASR